MTSVESQSPVSKALDPPLAISMTWGKSLKTLCPPLPQVHEDKSDHNPGRTGLSGKRATVSWARTGPIAGRWIHSMVKILLFHSSKEVAPDSPLCR